MGRIDRSAPLVPFVGRLDPGPRRESMPMFWIGMPGPTFGAVCIAMYLPTSAATLVASDLRSQKITHVLVHELGLECQESVAIHPIVDVSGQPRVVLVDEVDEWMQFCIGCRSVLDLRYRHRGALWHVTVAVRVDSDEHVALITHQSNALGYRTLVSCAEVLH